MKRIDSITIKNFKFAQDEAVFHLKGKNAIFYGQNGSGKSTVFWALYTFFESAFKDESDVRKYFDSSRDENLLNRYMQAGDDSYVKIALADRDKKITTKMISFNTIDTNCDLIKEVRMASDFINYRFLSRMYDVRNSQEIDIFPALSHDVLSYALIDEYNLGDLWNGIKDGLSLNGRRRYAMYSSEYKEYDRKVSEFNAIFGRYLEKLTQQANDIINNGFKEKITLNLRYENAKWNSFLPGEKKKRSYKLENPKVAVSIVYQGNDDGRGELKRPHTYLNEGRLTITFLAIRLAVSKLKPISNELQFIALDDLLLSLDMSYRKDVLDVLLKEFKGYQMLIMTHDLGFFNLFKSYYADCSWLHYSFLPDKPNLCFKEDKGLDDQLKDYMVDGEYEICASLLRKKLEEMLKKYFNEGIYTYDRYKGGLKKQLKKLENEIKDEHYQGFQQMVCNTNLSIEHISFLKEISLDAIPMGGKTKQKLINFHSELISLVSKCKDQAANFKQAINEVIKVLDRLNAGAHNNINMPQYKRELEYAIMVVEKLYNAIKTHKSQEMEPKVKQALNKGEPGDSFPAIEKILDTHLDQFLTDQHDTKTIFQQIKDNVATIDAKLLEIALGYVFNNRQNDLVNENINDFISYLAVTCSNEKDKLQIIGDFSACLLNIGIELNEWTKGKLDIDGCSLRENQTGGILKWEYYINKTTPF